jgi:dihydrofolate synthase/folylpolyglutamate synthase
MDKWKNSLAVYDNISTEFKMLLGDMLILCLRGNNVKLGENILDKYGKDLSKARLDESLAYAVAYFVRDSTKDKLVKLGADKNLLSIKPYSFGLVKFCKEFDSKISSNYYSRSYVNYIILKSVFAELGKPLEELKNVVHITGSNGKGSTGAFLRSILEAHGYIVNRYVKPSLIRINEEIIIHGKEIDDDYLYDIYKRIVEAFDRIKDTNEFREKIIRAEIPDNIKEHSNIINWPQMKVISSLLAFHENPADYNIVEVRAGGLKDLTNVFSEKETVATILTNIQHNAGNNDRTLWMINEKGEVEVGNRAVAYNKAMLGKMGIPMIVANQSEDTLAEIRRVAKEEVKTNTVEYGRDWFIKEETENSFVFEGCGHKFRLNKSKIFFEKFQTYNIATALATFLAITKDKDKIREDLIQRGIDKVEIVGRTRRIVSGRYREYFENDENIDVILSIIKPVVDGVNSIKSIIDSDYFNYFIFTIGNKHIMGNGSHLRHVLYLFDVLGEKNVVANSKLVIYKTQKEAFEFAKSTFLKNGTPFVVKNNLSSSLEFVKNDIKSNGKFHRKNRVFILSTPTDDFDKNILFLGGAF